MKKLVSIFGLILLSFSQIANSQTVGASQIKKKTNGGIVADSANALAVGVYRNTSAPSSPVTGQLWCDTNTTPCTLKTYSGTDWVVTPNLSTVTVGDTLADAPGSPTDGQFFFTRNPRVLWIYDGSAAKWYGGTGFSTATAFNIPTETLSSTQTIATPTDPITGMAYAANGGIRSGFTFSFKYTCVTSTGGETLASPASATYTSNTAQGKVTMTVPGCPGGTAKRYIYSTKENAALTGPWYQIGVINDNTTSSFTWDTYNWGQPNYYWTSNMDNPYGNTEPAQSYTGALPADYSVWNGIADYWPNHPSHPEYSGGCGVTANAQIYCRNSFTGGLISSTYFDPYVALRRNLTSYATQNYTIQYRMTYGFRPPTDNSISNYDFISGMCETNSKGTKGFWSYFANCGAGCSTNYPVLWVRYTVGTGKNAGANTNTSMGYPWFTRTNGHILWVRIMHVYSANIHYYYVFYSVDGSLWLATNFGPVYATATLPLNYLDLVVQYSSDSVEWGNYRNGAFTFDQFSLTIN